MKNTLFDHACEYGRTKHARVVGLDVRVWSHQTCEAFRPNLHRAYGESVLKTADVMLQWGQMVLKTAVAGCKSAFEN